VTWILQDRLRLLLRGEIVWVKARGSTGSCAWGSFQRPGNPVLRDLTERVVLASKGRFDRALSARQRSARRLPSEASISRDEFMEATTDLWEIPAESATRVGHPAPFPVELPERLIGLFTYRDDLVLDPFMGSGTTAVAALRTQRHFVGYDTDPDYVARSKERLEAERQHLGRQSGPGLEPHRVVVSGCADDSSEEDDVLVRAMREGRGARDLARLTVEQCGFESIEQDVSYPEGVDVAVLARDLRGRLWHFDVAGGFTSSRPGLQRAELLWKALGKAAVLASAHPEIGLVLLTTDAPTRGSAGEAALRALCGAGKPISEVIVLTRSDDLRRLRDLARAPTLPPTSSSRAGEDGVQEGR
jgi:site-specific DNA-methyltransferase (adenine-specific)